MYIQTTTNNIIKWIFCISWDDHTIFSFMLYMWCSGCMALELWASERRYPTSKVRSGGCEGIPMSKVRSGGQEEIPQVQCQRNPSKMVGAERGHQKSDRQKPHHRKLTNLIKWTTALSNSMKLWAMPCTTTKTDGSWWRVLTECGPLGKGMANHFSILALRTPWTVWRGKKRGHWKMNPPGQ